MGERRTRIPPGLRCILLAALALALAAPAARSAEEPSPPDPRELQIVRTLLRSLTGPRAAAPDLVVSKLAARGADAVPALYRAGQELREPLHVEVIVGALARVDRGCLEAYLLSCVAREEEGPATAAAWRHLGEYGGRQAVPAVIGRMRDNPYYTKRSAERALTRLLTRHDDEETWRLVGPALADTTDETRARVCLSIGETDSPLGLTFLPGLLGKWPAVDHAVVSAIAQMPEAGLGEKVVPHLRPLLESRDMNLRREAVTALAVFGDVDSARVLIANLADDRHGIRGNSLWALKTLSGLKFPEDPDRWRLWHAGEVAWWEGEGAGLMEILRSGTDLQIVEAARWVSEHRLYRMRFSPILRKLLDHPSPEVREAAEAALVRLGLLTSRSEPTAREALAARGFHALTRAEFEKAHVGDPARAVGPARPSRLVPIVGVLVLGLLLLRIFGPAALYRLRRAWTAEEKREGPVTVTLRRRRAEPTTAHREG